MWLILRLESEHLHNTEGFRRIDRVPLHFDHALKEQVRSLTLLRALAAQREPALVLAALVASRRVRVHSEGAGSGRQRR
jgi:hypothetical protein